MSTADASIEYDRSEPVVVVSNDTHIGPRLVEDLRAYCPAKHLDDFDRFAASTAKDRADAAALLSGSGYLDHPNLRTAGHHDPAARLADYDHDGIAAGVIFHGSMNMEPIPFIASGLAKAKTMESPELAAVGMSIYNRWLADFVSEAPNRHVGLAYLPMWDVDAAIAEIEWAHEAGLRAVNFPAMRDGELPEYNRSVWEPLWSVCEERRMPLVTHVGAGTGRALLQARRRRPPAIRVRSVHLQTSGLVADLRRRLRTPSRAQARRDRDAGQLVPVDGRRTRRVVGFLRRQARPTDEQDAHRPGATAAE